MTSCNRQDMRPCRADVTQEYIPFRSVACVNVVKGHLTGFCHDQWGEGPSRNQSKSLTWYSMSTCLDVMILFSLSIIKPRDDAEPTASPSACNSSGYAPNLMSVLFSMTGVEQTSSSTVQRTDSCKRNCLVGMVSRRLFQKLECRG